MRKYNIGYITDTGVRWQKGKRGMKRILKDAEGKGQSSIYRSWIKEELEKLEPGQSFNLDCFETVRLAA